MLVPIAWIALTGCRNIEAAPEDLDGLFPWYWQNYEAAGDADIQDATDKLIAALGEAPLLEGLDGTLSDLPADGPAVVGLDTPVDEAAGMFLAGTIGCGIVDLEAILVHLQQDTLYLDIYDRYERRYLSDIGAYLDRGVPDVAWHVSVDATVLGTSYSEELEGGLRYIPETEDHPAILLARTWLLEPATFESDNKSFEQDFQIEVYWARSGQEVGHAYGMWREMDFGSGFNTDDEGVVRLQLNGLWDWDARTTEICQTGEVPPLPE